MQIIAATNNGHKLVEIKRILTPMGHEVLSLREAGLAADPDETGATFAQNARIKAQAVANLCGKPVLADDSGLSVDALDGAPGVYSARFAGAHGGDGANNEKLLALLAGVPQEKRTAHFVCALALHMPSGAWLETEGRCDGVIAFAPRGANGFGYDPLFLVGARTFAELEDDEKDAISHRANALRAFAEKLPVFLQAEQE